MSEQEQMADIQAEARRAINDAYALGMERGRRDGYEEQANDHHRALITYDEQMAEVAHDAARIALLEAADAWEAEETPEMFRIAEEHYSAGGPSMPTIWLRLRARALTLATDQPATAPRPTEAEGGEAS